MKTVLAIGAHPDDIEIGCGGAELLLKKMDCSLVHVIATNGEEGDINSNPAELKLIRQNEARTSANVMGADQVHFLNLPDGATSFGKDEKIALMEIIRRVKPHIVFTHAFSDHFPDHAMVHQLTMAAIEGAKGPWFPLAGESPHKVDVVLGYEVWHPMSRYQKAVDISSVIEDKIHALNQHRSQTSGVDYLDAVRALARFRGVMAMAGQYAEVFEVLRADGPL